MPWGVIKARPEPVVEQEADYVLAVKENQPQLHAHLQQLFDRSDSKLHADPTVDYWFTQERKPRASRNAAVLDHQPD